MKRKIVLAVVFALAILALSLCACNSGTPCKHKELTAYEAVEATCEAEGNIEYWQCAKCDKYFADENGETEIDYESIVIAAVEHTEEIVPAVDATCEGTGLTEGKICAVCGAVLEEQEVVEALGHDWQWVVDKEATETETGLKHEQCTRCGATKNITPLEVLAHVHEIVEVAAVEPACNVAGNIQYWQCTKCDKYFADENGETELTLDDIVVAAKEHEFGDWAVVAEATCAVEGSEERECAICGEKEIRVLEKVAHTPSKWIIDVEPTCIDDGVCYKECVVCGEKLETEAIAALGHDIVVDEAVEATCETAGKTEGKHCAVCGAVLVEQTEIPALGHDWNDGEVTTDPTCTEKGVKTYKCARCEQLKLEEIAALEHVEVVDKAVAPTCTETGLTEGRHCLTCGAVLVAQEVIEANGHDYVDGVCTVCGEYVVSEGLEYTLNADGTAYIVTGVGTCTDTDIVIPATYNDLPVNAIGEKAFQNCTNLKSVTILNGTVSIAKDAFEGCENTVEIILK